MLSKIEEPRTAEHACVLAAVFAELANTAGSAERREMFLRLRDAWIVMANETQFKQSNTAKNIRMKRVRAFIAANPH